MHSDDVWLSTNKDFILDNYSGMTDREEFLVTIEFDSKNMTRGNLDDNEPVITVPIVTVKDIQKVIDYEIENSIVDSLRKKGVGSKNTTPISKPKKY